MGNPSASEAFRQGEQAAQMRIMDDTLQRMQDRLHELEAALRKLEAQSASEQYKLTQDMWTKVNALKEELNTIKQDFSDRVSDRVSGTDMLEFQRTHFHPLRAKVEKMEEFRLKALGVILAVATLLGAMSSYLMEELFKTPGP